jgi:hypothetical protein
MSLTRATWARRLGWSALSVLTVFLVSLAAMFVVMCQPPERFGQIVYASPRDAEERSALANICVIRLGIKLPALVDRFDDSTEKAYAGWPDRLYLIDRDGRIAYKSKPGPFGFTPADLEAAIRAEGIAASR